MMRRTGLTMEHEAELNGLFFQLWECHYKGIPGYVEGLSSVRANDGPYYYLAIRRGPLLLLGQSELQYVWMLMPEDGRTPEVLPGRHRCQVFGPGEAVPLFAADPGPWWDCLAEEIPQLNRELDDSMHAALLAAGRFEQLDRAREFLTRSRRELARSSRRSSTAIPLG